MSFTSGFIGGLAKSIDERLKDGMRRTEERADRILERTSIRAERESERAAEEQREVVELLENLASLVEDKDVPEGMTKYDYAAQLYKAGGSTPSSVKQLYTDLVDHRNKTGGSVRDLITFADVKTGGRGVGDYVNQFVRRPDTLVRVPKGMRGGVGLYGKLFDVDVTEGLQQEIDLSFPRGPEVEKFDVGQATIDRQKMVSALEYQQDKRKDELAIQAAEINLEKSKKEMAQLGTLGASEVRGFYSDFEDQHVKALGGTRDADTGDWIAPQGRPDAIKKGIGNALASLSKQAVASNNSHYKPEVQAALVGYAGAALVSDPPENGKPEIGRVYSKVINGVATKVLYLGYDADGNKIEPVVGQY